MAKVLGNEELNLLKQKSPFALPDNPSDKGLNAAQIKAKFWEGLLLLFNWLKEAQTAHNSENQTLTNNLNIEKGRIDVIVSYFADGKANFAIKDQNGNVIDTTYETKGDATLKFNTAIAQITSLTTALANGTNIPARAYADESGNNIKSSYASVLAQAGNYGTTNSLSFTLRLYNKNGGVLSTVTQSLPEATTAHAGLLNAEDKAKINNIASDIATCLASAKTYTDNKVARANLVSVLGEATQSLSGLLSSEDKRRLDVLYALLGESSDGDNVVNTINEVLAIFNSYPEGADLVSALALKVNISDIVDNLLSAEANKPLSANMGRYLKTLIDSLDSAKANAADVYTKSQVYTKTESGDLFRTQEQVDDQIDTKLAGVNTMNVIADEDNSKNYTYQIKIQSGKAHLIATEVE